MEAAAVVIQCVAAPVGVQRLRLFTAFPPTGYYAAIFVSAQAVLKLFEVRKV